MIETRNLKILPFSESNITNEYISWLNDPLLMSHSEQRHYRHDYESCLGYYKNFNKAQNIFAAIFLKNTNTHIGNINVYIDVFNNNADIGILIGSSEGQGKGLGFEAWIAMIAYLFQVKKIRKITAGTMANNHAMLKIMEKAHMVRESVRKKHFLQNAQEIDLIHAAIFKNDFEKRLQENIEISNLVGNLVFKNN